MKKNIKEINQFFKKNKKIVNIIFMIILLLIPMVVGLSIRMRTAQLSHIDNIAEQNVMNYYKQQIASDVENNYAYLPEARRNEIINENLAMFIRENRDRIQNEIKEVSEMMKESFRDDEGTPYMTDIDTWLFYYYATNYIEYGRVAEIVGEDGQVYEKYRGGRFERPQGNRFHPWLMAQTHKIWTLFDKDVPPMKSTSYHVMILAVLSLIPAFFIGRRLSNNFGGFVTAMFLAVHPVIMTRTVSNFADDDVYHLLFPLLAIWMVVEAYNSKDDIKRFIYSSLAGLSIAFHSISWNGWWYGALFILSGLFIYAIVTLVKEYMKNNDLKKTFLNSKNSLIMLGTYFVSKFLFVILLGGILGRPFTNNLNRALDIFNGPLHFLFVRFDVGTVSIWPNVMVTVAELRREPLNRVITQIGSPLIIFIAFVGLAMLFLNKELYKNDKILFWCSIIYYAILTAMLSNMTNVYLFVILTALPVAFVAIYSIFYKSNLNYKHSILLGIFLTGTIFSSTQGIRFMFLAIPIISILIGVTLGRTYDQLSEALFKSLSINKALSRAVLIVLMLWLVLPGTVESGYNTATRMMPMYNDAWDDTLNLIHEKTDDAIITSWWDFGHWFIANRHRVTFDGGDQGRRIHWVGKTLLTSNETEAISILRKLNCGQERPTEILEQYFTEYEAVQILYELVEVNDKEKAENVLRREGLSDENISQLMQYTYCDDLIDNYFIASSDMIGKSGVWGHFGIWDFNRALIYNRVRNSNMRDALEFLVEEFNYTETEARGTYNEIMTTDGEQWISPWPSYMSNVANCRENNGTIECENGVVINENMEAFVRVEQGLAKVSKFSYIENDEFKFVEQEDFETRAGVALFPSGNINQSIIMHEALTASMFTRMFFFEGFGLNNFEFINYERGIDGIEIYLYKVKWDE